MSENTFQDFVKTYMDLNVWTVCVVGLFVFGIYLFVLKTEKKKWNVKTVSFGLAWSLYLLIIISSTILNRKMSTDNFIKLELFWSYRVAMNSEDSTIVWQILYNVFMFIPWGIFLANKWECMKKPLLNIGSVLLASVTIELIQLIFRCGTVELDDVFHNVIGGITGYGIWRGYYDLKHKL